MMHRNYITVLKLLLAVQSHLAKSGPQSLQGGIFWGHWNRTFFTGWMPFMSPNQWCQSTEGTVYSKMYCDKKSLSWSKKTYCFLYDLAHNWIWKV